MGEFTRWKYSGQVWKIQERTGSQLRIVRVRFPVSRPWSSRGTSPEGRVSTPPRVLMMPSFTERQTSTMKTKLRQSGNTILVMTSKKPKLERQSSAVIEYKQQKSVEELAEEGAKYVESDEYKQAQKKMKDKKDKESKKKKNKVSFEDEKSSKTEKKDKKDKTTKQNENQGQNYKVFDGKSEKT